MAEETVWTGTPSQLKNLPAFAVAALADLLIVFLAILLRLPAALALLALTTAHVFWKVLLIQSRQYRLTTERLLTTEGIFSKTTETLELYRVKDLRMTQSFAQRLFSLESIEMISSDQDTPDLVIDSVPQSLGLSDKIRANVETCRVQKRTSEVELE